MRVFPVIDSFYSQLKQKMSAEDLQEEEKLYQEEYDIQMQKNREESLKSQNIKLASREEVEKRLQENREDLGDLKKLQGKTLYEKSPIGGKYIKLLYADENGYVTLDSQNLRSRSFSSEFASYKNLGAYDEQRRCRKSSRFKCN